MSGLILPGRLNAQPQHNFRIDYQGLGKGIRLLFNPALGPVDLATGRIWAANGNASIAAGQRGKHLSFDGGGDYYTYTGYPELTGNVGTFFIWCPVVGSTDDFGHVLLGSASPGAVAFQVSQFGAVQVFGSGLSAGAISWYNSTNRSLVFSSGGTAATCKAYLDGKDTGLTFPGAPVAWGAGNKSITLGRYPAGDSWDFNGTILLTGYTDAVWSETEARALHQNPWLLFKAPRRKLWPSSSSGEVTGSVAYTNADDTSAASGTTTVAGSSSTTNTDDASSASGSVGSSVSGSVAYTNQDDLSSSAGTTTVVGSSATVNADDTSSASGTTTVTGSISVANGNDTSAASGTTIVVGSSAATNTDDVCSAAGTVEEPEVIGTAVVTNADDTSAASGTTTIVGSVAYLNRNDTSSAEGLVNNGTLVESALTAGIAQTIRIKKPGIPVNTPEWLRTMLEILVGRRNNKIEIPQHETLTFSATPTQAECEALYAYTNKVRTALDQLITRLDS